ncbi:DUF4489 domain-containing protein [Syntrophomonas wolfei]|uniref:DUF4489 domain-containing protein n=1 Tax=Syntrophomonas wolfei subsp. wolfei (strain DSM 2245B / Goettingen) TaxID=335541 RepID=Q0AZA9_SYNWW|nr:DUF4489 domain-containing protein [Syntrophomonas wolfei]ABI67945.1 hypothetical protein Swol_0616 [Syntrophomonas wolfei subsp. wolfei str. Goettingen G311]
MSNYKLENPGCCPPYPPCPPRLNQTILSCGTGSGVKLPSISEYRSQLVNPYVVASLSIDTSNLSNPSVKLDFSSIITYKELYDYWLCDLRLTFQLSRVCGGAKAVLGNWNFERNVGFGWYGNNGRAVEGNEAELRANGFGITVETVDAFGFTFCDCHACPGCCTYMVEVINAETSGVDFADVSHPMFNALAVGPLAWGD